MLESIITGEITLRVFLLCSAASVVLGIAASLVSTRDALMARTAATGGFGIGLSIARSICEAQRGAIRAEMSGETIAFIAELK